MNKKRRSEQQPDEPLVREQELENSFCSEEGDGLNNEEIVDGLSKLYFCFSFTVCVAFLSLQITIGIQFIMNFSKTSQHFS